MTNEEYREQVKEKIENIIFDARREPDNLRDDSWQKIETKYANQILSVPEIAIMDPDQSLPQNPFNYEDECREYMAYSKALRGMVNQNWCKVIKEK